jgi:hypothetical protein
MAFKETTTEQDAARGVRSFVQTGQMTRCRIELAWQEEVDYSGAPEWRALPAPGNRAVTEELMVLLADLTPVLFGSRLPG